MARSNHVNASVICQQSTVVTPPCGHNLAISQLVLSSPLLVANMSMSGVGFWPSIPHSQRPESNDGHRGWNHWQRHPASLEESVINAVLDATDPVAVLTKQHRNSVCAVTRILPPELLSYVFSINVLCDHPRPKNGGYNLGWISVTHVCHQWREVALATSSLWGYLDFTSMSRKWCTEMLRRSGNCSLEIALRVTSCSGLHPLTTPLDIVQELVRPECSARLAGLKLDLRWLTRSDAELILHSLRCSAPLLEFLVLQQTSRKSMTISSLACCLPSLRRFTLHNIFLSPWISPIFANLHDLHIGFDPHRLLHSQDTLPSYDDMATMLRRVPELRCLMLRNVFTEGTDAHSEGMPSEAISLPRLQKLSLIDQQDCDMLSFTYLLRLPPATCEIKTNGRLWRRISDPASLFSQYERTFGPVRRLKLLANGHPQITLEFRVSDALTVESSAPSQLRLDYALPLPSHPRATAATAAESQPPHRRIALHFGDISLRLDDVLCLEIVSHAAWPADGWHALFRRATRLRRIRVTYRGAVDGFIQVLSTQHERRAGQTQPLFPDLRTVKLSLVDLDEADVLPRTRGDLLVEGLARRRELGFGIQELEVSDRDGRWTGRLRAIVPGVAHADI